MTVFQRRNNGNDDFGLTLRKFCFYVMMLQIYNLYINVKKICISTSKHYQFINTKTTSKFNDEAKMIYG